MKKAIVVLMVLSMATMASAALRLSTASTLLVPGQSTTLSITTDAVIEYMTGTYNILVVNTDAATIDYLSGIAEVADSGMMIYHDGDAIDFLGGDERMVSPPAGTNGVGFMVFDIDLPAIPAGTMLFNDIKLTCRGFQNAVVSLYNVNEDFDTLTLLDTVVIHQIPEPMTLGLLGIGGLFLRRRK